MCSTQPSNVQQLLLIGRFFDPLAHAACETHNCNTSWTKKNV